jgi:FkbM family methyltransferase
MASNSASPSVAQWLLRGAMKMPIPKRHALYALLAPHLGACEGEFTVDFFGLKYKGELSEYVDRHIFFFGSYSPAELRFLRRATEMLRANRSNITFADVGANVGQHSLYMSRFADRIIAFEPNEAVAYRLSQNIDLNNLRNIEIVRCALGDEAGSGSLGSGLARNSGSRSLVWSLDAERDNIVAVARGDDVMRELDVKRVDLLKVDVEGYEKKMFAGMQETLLRDRPVILFELVGREIKGGFSSEKELRDALYPDAVLYTLSGNGGLTLLPFDWRKEEAVCVPMELAKDLAAMQVSSP